MIVCIGWGSLIWCQKTLPVQGKWRLNGPKLQVEFARELRDKRITLVLCDSAPAVTTLWAKLDVADLEHARRALAAREGISDDNIRRGIGHWSPDGQSGHPAAGAIAEWAKARGAVGVVWTALKPKFGADYRVPGVDEVIDHLAGLSGAAARPPRNMCGSHQDR